MTTNWRDAAGGAAAAPDHHVRPRHVALLRAATGRGDRFGQGHPREGADLRPRIEGYTPATVWELIWLMLIMKIPIIYLCWVVYWAIKSEPRPEQPAALVPAEEGPDPHGWRPTPHPRRPRPHGAPTRTYARTSRARVRA